MSVVVKALVRMLNLLVVGVGLWAEAGARTRPEARKTKGRQVDEEVGRIA